MASSRVTNDDVEQPAAQLDPEKWTRRAAILLAPLPRAVGALMNGDASSRRRCCPNWRDGRRRAGVPRPETRRPGLWKTHERRAARSDARRNGADEPTLMETTPHFEARPRATEGAFALHRHASATRGAEGGRGRPARGVHPYLNDVPERPHGLRPRRRFRGARQGDARLLPVAPRPRNGPAHAHLLDASSTQCGSPGLERAMCRRRQRCPMAIIRRHTA